MEETRRFEQALNSVQSEETIGQNRPFSRSQSVAALDNRLSGFRRRSSTISAGLMNRFSFRLKRNETELGKITSASVTSENQALNMSVLDEALRHASEPEQYFFVMLDQDLNVISQFYNGKL
ncbi:hypothetical protein BD770DRAFT_441937 [Pilaira anomala]|nr:hypothetical protein BD770DRAFT_441937 [Pilaira anomala]